MATQLSRRVQVGLDAARALAAIYVVLHHVAEKNQIENTFGVLVMFGQQAVVVFFLLSGFVIFANERQRALQPSGYYVRRLRRIYPMLIATLALSTILCLEDGTFRDKFSLAELFGTLAALQDLSKSKPGVIVDPFLGNGPLWSLSYEITFYLAFPWVLRLWARTPRRANHLIGATCCLLTVVYILAPNHFALVGAYFLSWWCGAMAANAYLDGQRRVRALAVPLGWLLAQCAIAAVAFGQFDFVSVNAFPCLLLQHFISAALLLVIFFGPAGEGFVELAALTPALWRFLASISFAIYLFHYPLLITWRAAGTVSGQIGAALLLVAVAIAVERFALPLIPTRPSRSRLA